MYVSKKKRPRRRGFCTCGSRSKQIYFIPIICLSVSVPLPTGVFPLFSRPYGILRIFTGPDVRRFFQHVKKTGHRAIGCHRTNQYHCQSLDTETVS